MPNEQSYYQILGLVPDAEHAVIKAAYRALVHLYHPDKGREQADGERISDLNTAYSVLSDPEKRREYDLSREKSSIDENDLESDSNNSPALDAIEKPWQVVIEFHSELDELSKDLERLSWRLCFAFKLAILESKKFDSSEKIAKEMKSDYLSRYFGKNKDTQSYAEEIIRSRHKQAALYLNEVVNVLGNSISLYNIERKIESRFPGLQEILHLRQEYVKVRNNSVLNAIYLLKYHGISVKQRFFSSRTDIEFDGKKITFPSDFELCKFVLKKYLQYA